MELALAGHSVKELPRVLFKLRCIFTCALLRSDSILHLHAAEYIGSVFVKKGNVDFLWVTQKELIA